MSQIMVGIAVACGIGGMFYAFAVWRALWRLYGQQRLPERDGEYGGVS